MFETVASSFIWIIMVSDAIVIGDMMKMLFLMLVFGYDEKVFLDTEMLVCFAGKMQILSRC